MFKVTIEEIKTIKKMGGKDWMTIGRDDNDKSIYGYTPEIEKDVEVKQIIYTQLVEILDLAVVIQAINNML